MAEPKRKDDTAARPGAQEATTRVNMVAVRTSIDQATGRFDRVFARLGVVPATEPRADRATAGVRPDSGEVATVRDSKERGDVSQLCGLVLTGLREQATEALDALTTLMHDTTDGDLATLLHICVRRLIDSEGVRNRLGEEVVARTLERVTESEGFTRVYNGGAESMIRILNDATSPQIVVDSALDTLGLATTSLKNLYKIAKGTMDGPNGAQVLEKVNEGTRQRIISGIYSIDNESATIILVSRVYEDETVRLAVQKLATMENGMGILKRAVKILKGEGSDVRVTRAELIRKTFLECVKKDLELFYNIVTDTAEIRLEGGSDASGWYLRKAVLAHCDNGYSKDYDFEGMTVPELIRFRGLILEAGRILTNATSSRDGYALRICANAVDINTVNDREDTVDKRKRALERLRKRAFRNTPNERLRVLGRLNAIELQMEEELKESLRTQPNVAEQTRKVLNAVKAARRHIKNSPGILDVVFKTKTGFGTTVLALVETSAFLLITPYLPQVISMVIPSVSYAGLTVLNLPQTVSMDIPSLIYAGLMLVNARMIQRARDRLRYGQPKQDKASQRGGA